MKKLFTKINQAREILELPESATMNEIRRNHRRLLKIWHPDVGLADKKICHKMTMCIEDAFHILMEYCQRYKFSFSEKEVKKYISPEEWWLDRFGQDPLWGKHHSDRDK